MVSTISWFHFTKLPGYQWCSMQTLTLSRLLINIWNWCSFGAMFLCITQILWLFAGYRISGAKVPLLGTVTVDYPENARFAGVVVEVLEGVLVFEEHCHVGSFCILLRVQNCWRKLAIRQRVPLPAQALRHLSRGAIPSDMRHTKVHHQSCNPCTQFYQETLKPELYMT